MLRNTVHTREDMELWKSFLEKFFCNRENEITEEEKNIASFVIGTWKKGVGELDFETETENASEMSDEDYADYLEKEVRNLGAYWDYLEELMQGLFLFEDGKYIENVLPYMYEGVMLRGINKSELIERNLKHHMYPLREDTWESWTSSTVGLMDIMISDSGYLLIVDNDIYDEPACFRFFEDEYMAIKLDELINNLCDKNLIDESCRRFANEHEVLYKLAPDHASNLIVTEVRYNTVDD